MLDRCSIERLRADVNSGAVNSTLKDKKGKDIVYRKGIAIVVTYIMFLTKTNVNICHLI